MEAVAKKFLEKAGQYGVERFKFHIENNDLPWRPLSEAYLEQKRAEGYSSNILERSGDLYENLESISRGFEEYQQIKLYKKPIQITYYISLSIVALLVLFCAIWFGFYLAKTISIPIKELAEGTRKVAEGDLGFTIGSVADDEIGSLVEFHVGVFPTGMNHPVFHLPIVEHQDDQHPVAGQGQKLHLSQGHVIAPRQRDHTGHLREMRQKTGRRIHQFLR